MCRSLSLLFAILLLAGICSSSVSTAALSSTDLYVVPFPSLFGTDGDGSLAHPYTSIQQALDHIENEYHRRLRSSSNINIQLYPTYHFVDTLYIRQVHSQTRMATMTDEDTAFYDRLLTKEHTYQRLTTATVSGGISITNWMQTSTNTYSATVQQPVFINQLFMNNQRIVRTRVPTNQSDYLHYATPLKDPDQARYGFQYAPGQFNYSSLTDAMVIVYHSWTTSHHYIDHLVPQNNTIFFTNPSDRPIGSMEPQGNHRFHIENLCEALVPNTFCFVNQSKTLYLMTDGSYNPNSVQIIAPIYEFVVIVAGESVNKSADDIIINNVAIQHSTWNIDRTQQADYQAAAFITTAAVYIANATAMVVSGVEVSHTGTYAIWVKEGTTNINIMNSLVTDTGAGGIRLGQMMSPVPTPTTSVNIMSNEVSYGGNVFPEGVAIISHRAMDVLIADNHVHHHRYTGISVGWQWGYAPSETNNVLVQSNYIHDTGRHILCDQGGIYTLGVQPGTVITNNVIKNVYSYAGLMWGIYLDEGTSQIVVSNNVVYNTGWSSLFQHYGANNTIINNVFARASLIPPPQPGDSIPDGDTRIQLGENHMSWLFTRNIIYDAYQGRNHSVVRFDQSNVTACFNNNTYYNPYGTLLLYGYQQRQMSFADWQKIGQDNNSVIADPLFAGDVNQCDFFTVQADSPAAQLGFANITKLAKWTPGCETENEDTDYNFYHW